MLLPGISSGEFNHMIWHSLCGFWRLKVSGKWMCHGREFSLLKATILYEDKYNFGHMLTANYFEAALFKN